MFYGKIAHEGIKNKQAQKLKRKMEDPKSQLLAKLKESNNVLVTVSSNPSVDQLAAAIGFTLMLNKMGKHATAVFSGAVPSTIEFLQPEKTIEKNTDSLRDFIISLDKAKADKLRYKVEDKMVKIFITPYRTSIGEADLVFSQGDFNVDVVVALGVHEQKDLDQAITSHGRILHDAVVSSVNNTSAGSLGTINWVDTTASSLCELVGQLVELLKADALDGQMATALLTGIVAETKRFSNEKTTSSTMAMSAKLMAAGANQQLVATKLQEQPIVAETIPDKPQPATVPDSVEQTPPQPEAVATQQHDGALEIKHDLLAMDGESEEDKQAEDQIHIDEHGTMLSAAEVRQKVIEPLPSESLPSELPPVQQQPTASVSEGSRLIMEPPSLGGRLTANTDDEVLDPSIDPLSGNQVGDQPLLSHDTSVLTSEEQTNAPTPDQILPEPASDSEVPEEHAPVINDSQTLSDLEQAVDSPHQEDSSLPPSPQAESPAAEPEQPPSQDISLPDLDAARDAVVQAADQTLDPNAPLPPIEALNANPVNLDLHDYDKGEDVISSLDPPATSPDGTSLPTSLFPPEGRPMIDPTASNVEDPTAPPDVPPPMLPEPPSDDENGPALPPIQY